MNENRFARGWDEERVRRLLAHYEQQSEEEAVAEDEAAAESETDPLVAVPKALVPAVRDFIAKRVRGAGTG